MKDRISVTPKILSLNDTNDIYMTMNIIILSENINYNNAQFTHDFIEGVVENKEEYIGIPFLVNRDKLEDGDFDNLTHELDVESGELKTDQIGSFIDFWEDEVDETKCLLGSIRIFKRFSETCSKIIELVKDNKLETSCEVMVTEYQEISDDGTRIIHYNEGKNALFGSAIVTHAAEPMAKPTLLIAEAYQKDIKDIESQFKGGEKLDKKENKDKIETFNKGVEIKYHGTLETSASLKWQDVGEKIYNLVNPVDVENGGRDYNYYIRDLFTSYVILEDWDDHETLYKANYTIEGDVVTIAPKEDWVQGTYGFIPNGIQLSELISQNEKTISDLESELNDLKEEKEAMSKDNKTTMEELQEKIKTLETKVSDLKEKNKKLEETIVLQKEENLRSEEKVEELNEVVEELTKYKEKVERAEKEAKEKELSEKYSKLLSEETFKSEEVQNAISELDEATLNSIVVSEIAKIKASEANNKKEDIEIAAMEQDDLIEPTILQKYGLD